MKATVCLRNILQRAIAGLAAGLSADRKYEVRTRRHCSDERCLYCRLIEMYLVSLRDSATSSTARLGRLQFEGLYFLTVSHISKVNVVMLTEIILDIVLKF